MLFSLLENNNFVSVCIVIDQALIKLEIIDKMIKNLRDPIIIECDISEPTYDKLEQKRFALENKR